MASKHIFAPPRIRCREIADADLDSLCDLLVKAPFGRPRDFWVEALQRLGAHPTPRGYPRYGYLLEVNGIIAGVLLVITASVRENGDAKIRRNLSSLFVWPSFRPYGSLLSSVALKLKEATYTDLSPLTHTVEMIEAQGFRRYSTGRFIGFPLVKLRSRYRARVSLADIDLRPADDMSAEEISLLLDHAAYGYISVVVISDGQRYPFVFEQQKQFRVLRSAYLIYCGSIDDLVRFARPLGLFFARRGIFAITTDANDRIAGLLGWYENATPKFYRGPNPPRLGDLAYSERVVLGLRFPATVAPEEPEAGQ
jgi:hypothetical protein